MASKSEAGYFCHAYVLAPPSEALRPLVGRLPFQLIVAASATIERVIEGKA